VQQVIAEVHELKAGVQQVIAGAQKGDVEGHHVFVKAKKI